VPDDNPLTAETVALGRRLFFDKRFSMDNSTSCASCHDPNAGGADPNRVSVGVNGQLGSRNAPTVFNAAYNPTQFWDGRASSLEQQAEGPVQNPVEMAHSLVGVERRLASDPAYVRDFELAFGPGRITYSMVEKSISAYERTLLSGNSAFDRYFYGGDKTAMNESAIRGLGWFTTIPLDQPSCANCHRIFPTSATFAEERFHNTGGAWDPLTGTLKDIGRGAFSSNRLDQGAFRTPTLRNIALTAPYMHDGSMKTLEEVLDFYFQGGVHNPFISGALPGHVDGEPLTVPAAEVPQAKRDIIEFMKALTGNVPANAFAPEAR
jgi:cytochrome c peroxidase